MNVNENYPETEYLFTIFTGMIHNEVNQEPYLMNGHAMQFKATPSAAKRRLFETGYILDSEMDIFSDDMRAFVSEFWSTTPETSEEDDVPDRLRILVPGHPYVRIFPNARFERLLITRSPTFISAPAATTPATSFIPTKGGKYHSKRVNRAKRLRSRRSRRC